MTRQATVGILLAAGSGRRFDATGARNKLLQLLDDGTSVAQHSARTLLKVLANVVAVVSNEKLAAQLTQLGCQVLLYPGAEQGMGATLAYAVSHVAVRFPEAQSVLIGLADMPYVQSDTVSRIVTELEQGAGIVQPVYEQQAGHPVGFASCYFAALMALQGDTGARHLLREFPVLRLAVQDPGIILDIDYLSDIQLNP